MIDLNEWQLYCDLFHMSTDSLVRPKRELELAKGEP
jgi:hypothetical protein